MSYPEYIPQTEAEFLGNQIYRPGRHRKSEPEDLRESAIPLNQHINQQVKKITISDGCVSIEFQ